MSVTLGYFNGEEVVVVALLAYANRDGDLVHVDHATHAWVSDGVRHTDGIGFDDTGEPYLVHRADLR